MNSQQTIEEPKNIQHTESKTNSFESLDTESSNDPTYSEAKTALKEAGDHARKRMNNLLDQARESTTKQADRYVDDTGSKIRAIERVTRESADKLREEEPQFLIEAIEWLADVGDTTARYFEKNSSRDVLRDMRAFARKRPAIVLGGLAAAGFLAGRFLKSSETES